MENKKLIVSFAIPIVVMFLFLFMQIWIITTGKEVILPVSGYDPRDLLSGRYLSFTVNYPGNQACTFNEGAMETKSCYCIRSLDSDLKVIEGFFSEDCVDQQFCQIFIKGKCNYGQFDAGINQFFIPESKADLLDKKIIKENAWIRLKVDRTGNAIIEDIIWNE